VTSALASHPPLTAADRCDRCGAQAYVRVTLPSGGELFFCAHHGRAHEARLREVSTSIQDETDLLHETPARAPDEER
jgi:ribosomal protein L37E